MKRAIAHVIGPAKRRYWLKRIDQMGIVDREYFEVLTGQTFASDRAAIRFYLRHGNDPALGLALNPLIETSWLDHQLDDMNASWYVTLLRRTDLFSTSPYFDASSYTPEKIRGTPAAGATLSALQHFLAHVTPATLIPVHVSRRGRALTWAECREQALGNARLFKWQLDLRRARTTANWDPSAEQQFMHSIHATLARQIESHPGKVSIVMPTRDRLHLLEEAIRSVQSQTYEDWELIVVDDGSTDRTAQLLERIVASDERIMPISQASAGVSAARNRGLAAATGDYVAFLDSDNTWRSDFLRNSLAGMMARGVDAVHSGIRLRGDNEVIRYRGLEGTRDDLLYAGNFIDLNAVVLSKALMDAVGGFDESIKRWVDYDLFLAISAEAVPAYLPFVGVDYDNRTSPGRITGSELPSWEDVVVGKHLIDWNTLTDNLPSRERGAASIIIPTFTDWQLTAAAVNAVLDNSGSRSIEIIVIDNGSRRHVYALLRALFGSEPRVSIVRMPRNLNFALANNYALSLSRGEYVVMLNNDTEVTAGWLEPLVAPLVDDSIVLGTQPLLLYPDGTIQTAGTVFLDGESLPQHFLTGHPAEDASAITEHSYSAVTAAALCMRAADLVALHGFDPLYTNGLEDVDLCLRARRSNGGSFRVVPESVVYHHESKTPGRARAVSRNRALFLLRWGSSLPTSDLWRYKLLGLEPE